MQRKTAWPRGRGDGGSEEPCRSWFSSRVCVGMDQWEGQEGTSRAVAQRLCRDLGYSMWLGGRGLDSGSEGGPGREHSLSELSLLREETPTLHLSPPLSPTACSLPCSLKTFGCPLSSCAGTGGGDRGPCHVPRCFDLRLTSASATHTSVHRRNGVMSAARKLRPCPRHG